MNETGIEFDMNPETFTLANLFAMELHRFNETIQGIVTSASKELQIEKVYFNLSRPRMYKD
jgi:dynein heavy chain